MSRCLTVLTKWLEYTRCGEKAYVTLFDCLNEMVRKHCFLLILLKKVGTARLGESD